MGLKSLRLFVALCCFFFIHGIVDAQNFSFSCVKDTTIPGCLPNPCIVLKAIIPDLHDLADAYTVNRITTSSSTCVPVYSSPNDPGGIPTSLVIDDRYTSSIPIGFPFPFYGTYYNNLLASTNGIICFDIARANGFSHYSILNNLGSLSSTSGIPQDLPSTLYDPALIMAPYHDLNPAYTTSPTQKIQYITVGTAPHRRWILSYYRVPLFNCSGLIENTHQIVLYESTGIIEVVIFSKQICGSWNQGRAMIGIQNFARNVATMAPGRKASDPPWGTVNMNEAWRFVPSNGNSLFKRVELYDFGGALLQTGTTTNLLNGTLEAAFSNICTAPGTTTSYIVKSVYTKIDDPLTEIFGTDTIRVIRNAALDLSATATTVPTGCGPGVGSVSVTVPPGIGTAPYQYSLNGGVLQPGNTFSGLIAGTYTMHVEDVNGCNSTFPAIVTQTFVLNATTSTAATSCPGISNGTITINTVSGTGPYSFILDGGAPQPGVLPFNFNNVAAGNHNIIVNDLSNGCVSPQIPVNVAVGPSLSTTVSKTDVLCNGGNTGSITVTPPPGGPPFQYSLNGSPWLSSNVFNGLTANTYNVMYQNGIGCLGSQSITINQPLALSFTFSTTAAICNGQNNGTIIVTPVGGSAPYQYSFNGAVSWQASNTFNGGANIYGVAIRDNNNCTFTQPVPITQPAALIASATTTAASCNGGPDGTITVTASGGNGSYQYSTDGTTFQPSNVFNVLAGSYIITIKDNMGCTTTANATVNLTSNLAFSSMTDVTICEGTSTTLQLNSNANVYSWSPTTSLNNPSIFNPVANPTTTTDYYVTATLGSCSLVDTVRVIVNPAPIPNAGPDGAICYGQTYQLQASGGTSFSWSPSTYLSNTAIPDPVSIPDRTITYTLSVIDANGCNSLVTDDMILDVTQPIHVATFPYDTIGYPGDQFQLTASAVATSFVWSPPTGLDNPNIANPIVTVQDIGGDVMYRVTASTAAGCKGEGYVRLRVFAGPDIYVPTGFSPNQDGLNDTFFPFPVGIVKLNYFRVFNRWGILMYSTVALNQGWDGKYAGKEQASGGYVWMAQGVTKDGRIITKKGTIMLIR